jgi:hypothetical protein
VHLFKRRAIKMSLQAYNSATDTLTPIAENDYKDSLEKISALPIASANLLNMCYLLTANQGSYVKGGIYQCQSDGSGGYTWILVNGSGVPVDTVEDGNMNAVTSNAVSDKFDTLGTASAKDATDLVRPNSHDLVESGSVYSAINNALSSIYTPRGTLTCAELTSALLIDDNVGNVYEMSDSGTTSALFIQGAGETISVSDNVGIIKAGTNTYLFNLMGNAFDLTDYQKKDLTTAVEGATTVEGALGALSSGKVSTDLVPSDASSSNKLVTESDTDYFYQASDVEGEYDANDFAVVGKITRYCVKSPAHGYQVDGTAWWGFYETVCFRGGGYGYQTFRTMLGTPAMAIRQLYNGSWGGWQKLVTESEIYPYKSTTDVGYNVLNEIKTSADAVANYKMFSGNTQAGMEGSWFGFKKTANFWHCEIFTGQGAIVHVVYDNGTYTQRYVI